MIASYESNLTIILNVKLIVKKFVLPIKNLLLSTQERYSR